MKRDFHGTTRFLRGQQRFNSVTQSDQQPSFCPVFVFESRAFLLFFLFIYIPLFSAIPVAVFCVQRNVAKLRSRCDICVNFFRKLYEIRLVEIIFKQDLHCIDTVGK